MTTLLNSSVALSSPLFLSQTFLADLERGAMSAPVLGPEASPVRDMAVRSLRGEIGAGVVADRLWRRLAIGFGQSVPGCRVVEGETVEFHVLENEFAVFDPVNIHYILGEIQSATRGALSVVEKNGDETIFRFPPLSRLESAARLVFGEEAVNLYFSTGEIGKRDCNQGHALRKQPIALPLEPQFFEQVGHKVPEFVYAIHDVHHAFDVASIHSELLKIAVVLNETLMDLPEEFQETVFVRRQIHDLTELFRIGRLSLDGFLKRAFSPWEEQVRAVHYQLISASDRARLSDLCRRYVDLVFDAWIPKLSEDRRPSVNGYRVVLHSLAQSFLRHP